MTQAAHSKPQTEAERAAEIRREELAGHAILDQLAAAPSFNKWMADTIRPYIGQRLLEVGAGTGNLTRHLFPRQRYVASDFDPFHLDSLRQLAARTPGLEVQRIDATDWSCFAALEGQIDTIVCLNVLEHIPDSRAALENFLRVLAPGGRLIVLVPNGPWLYCDLDRALEHVLRYTPALLRQAVAERGFEVERVFQFNRMGVVGWFLNGKLRGVTELPTGQLRFYDRLVWLWRAIDRLLPWHGLSVTAVGRKPG